MIYTIVLVPSLAASSLYIEASQSLFRPYQPTYLLDTHHSFPHITIAQFECEKFETAQQVWQQMRLGVEETSLTPPFTGLSFLQGQGPYQDTYWVELSIARGTSSSPLMVLHETTIHTLYDLGLEPLNPHGNNYRPHLTLARIVKPNTLPVWQETLFQKTRFHLAWGRSDAFWQLAEIFETVD